MFSIHTHNTFKFCVTIKLFICTSHTYDTIVYYCLTFKSTIKIIMNKIIILTILECEVRYFLKYFIQYQCLKRTVVFIY